MEYFLNTGVFGSIFAVPDAVVDNYIKLANEASIKVLLYVLRNNERKLSSNDIASALNITESQVEEAFIFWENANIFPKGNKTNAIADNTAKVHNESADKLKTAEPVNTKKISKPNSREYNMNPSEIAKRIDSSEEIKCLFVMSEQTFGRPLTHIEQQSFIWIHDYLGLSTEVILMIVTFCIDMDKSSSKYIETVAYDWAEREINTLDLAQAEIKRIEESTSYNNKIMKICQMDRKPTSKQQEFISSWKEKNYSLDLIEAAYELTIDNTAKLNFPYMNKILLNWESEGIRDKSQIQNNKKTASADKLKKEYSFDLDEYKALVNNFGD